MHCFSVRIMFLEKAPQHGATLVREERQQGVIDGGGYSVRDGNMI